MRGVEPSLPFVQNEGGLEARRKRGTDSEKLLATKSELGALSTCATLCGERFKRRRHDRGFVEDVGRQFSEFGELEACESIQLLLRRVERGNEP